MNDQLRTLVRQAIVSVDIVTGNEALDDELAKMYIPDCFAEKFAELIVKDVLGCYNAIDNGNTVEGTDDFVKAVAKRYDL